MNSYILIIIPPEQIIELVKKYRKKYAKYTNYVIPPHVTIYPPFYTKNTSEEEIVEYLKKSFSGTKPQEILLNSIGYFEGKNNVAFLKLNKESSDFIKSLLVKATNTLKGKVKNVYDDYNFTPKEFKPHMTLVEKIPRERFSQIRTELGTSTKIIKFDVLSLFLYRQKSKSKVWNELSNIKLSMGETRFRINTQFYKSFCI